ncbi:cytochrome P450 94C1 [Diospyros lotus]|uniref:cytochrome P450 94C1 n=1 Tax=Diospyros lotus TaxID=55363 RepID=UPI00225AE656|nr:cytochrome P450 94C1 [Diospyros lotus]
MEESFYATFCSSFFYAPISLVVFSLLIFTLSWLINPSCNCEICQSYITKSWTSDFDNLCDWYTHLLRNSPTGTVHVHALNNIITGNPENVEHILQTRFENYPKGKPFSEIMGDFLGRGIFNVDGELWKFQRKMASLELGSVSIKSSAFEVVSSEIQSRLIPLLSSKENCVLDLQDVFRRFSLDNFCRFSFGLDPGCLQLSLPISDFSVAFDLASKLSAQRAMAASQAIWKVKRLLNLGSEKKLKEAIKMVMVLVDEVIEQRRKLGFFTRKDLLSRFMATTNDDGYLRDIVISFLLAGHDTVASSLTGLFWLLAHHPKVVQAIRDESDRIMGSTRNLANFEQMKDMNYLKATIYESLRLYPPVQFDSKFCQADDTLPDGTFVARGTRVTYHPYAMGRMERVWGEGSLDFKPERWLQDGVFRPVSPFKYSVFQAGIRVCLGKELALELMKIVTISLIRQFDFRAVMPTHRPRFIPGLTATISGGLPVLIQERRA